MRTTENQRTTATIPTILTNLTILTILALSGCGIRESLKTYHAKANVEYAYYEAEGFDNLPEPERTMREEAHEARKATPLPKAAKVRRLIEAFKSADGAKAKAAVARAALKAARE